MKHVLDTMAGDLAGNASAAGANPHAEIRQQFCQLLAEVIGVEKVSPDDHFFDDLGADSMVMARFCARLRKRPDLPAVAMKDVYGNPTVTKLVHAVLDTPENSGQQETFAPPPIDAASRYAGTFEFLLCGALQLSMIVAFAFLPAFIFDQYYWWVTATDSLVGLYIRSAVVALTAMAAWFFIPVGAKLLLVGTWEKRQIRIWSLAYFRFWVVTGLIKTSPMAFFAGSPIYNLYLRMLGARIGKRVVILSAHMPLCTDLISIGDDTVIRKGSFFTGYRARAGLIETGSVTIGRNVIVGEGTTLDINTSIGDNAQLGHSSSLYEGQSIPAGHRRYGSPAVHTTDFDYRAVGPAKSGALKRVIYSIFQVVPHLFITGPTAVAIFTLIVQERAPLGFLARFGIGEILLASLALFVVSIPLGLLSVAGIPRLLSLLIKPDKAYPLYGIRFWVHASIAAITNNGFFKYLFGDSSYVVNYLRWLGYDLSNVQQTGSNFGLDFVHETPFHVTVGRGTMIADGISVINAHYSSTSFMVTRATIGPNNFIGNYVAYPSQSTTGENCLLATKAQIPVAGPPRADTGLLGSPNFEIPRSVLRDNRFDHMKQGDEFVRRLAAKNRHNLATMALFLLVQWINAFALIFLLFAAADLYIRIGVSGIALAALAALIFSVAFHVLVERASIAFRALRPEYCSIYERKFWAIERYWKLAWQPFLLDGTVFKGLVWRLLGVRTGKRLFDDGCLIMDKTLVAIGDDCTLNVGSIIQPHSQEDGTFKSDRVAIGSRCTVGINSLIHYGVTIGDDSIVGVDTFVMKGTEISSHALWAENPAREIGRWAFVTTKMAAPSQSQSASSPALVSGVHTP